jgi:hypothetical protein
LDGTEMVWNNVFLIDLSSPDGIFAGYWVEGTEPAINIVD